MLDFIIVMMLVIIAIMLPIEFAILNWVEDWIERKYGNDTRKSFLKWTQYISIGLILLCILGGFITFYFYQPFHTPHV